ncbi:MAG: acyltransferase family protein [Pseudomonadota bacterium]|nr:acyltransferase family protein [Pseudomonadota bacterium]
MAEKYQRYHGFDLLRGFALICGIVIHAPLALRIDDIVGDTTNVQIPIIIDLISGWIHQWRMPVFFLIAGFFSHMKMIKKNVLAFAHDRVARLIPSLIFFSGFYALIWDSDFGELFHLWFIYYLFIISIFTSFFQYVSQKLETDYVDKFLAYFADKKFGFFLYLIPITLLTFWGRTDGIEGIIPKHFFQLEVKPLIYYWSWFLLGQIIFTRKHLIVFTQKLGVIIFFVATSFLCQFASWFLLEHTEIRGLTINFFSASATFSWAFLFIGLFTKLICKPIAILNFLVKVSYPVYLVHLAPAIFFGAIFFKLGLYPMTIFLLNIMTTSIASLAIYFFFIKFTPLDWIISGYSKSWLQPFSRRVVE